MEQYKQEFIDFMVESDVLKFGDFTLKSGRKSPFFMNAGAYVTGTQLARLGEYYAKAIHETYGDDFDVLFGPAYKGIPISVVTAVAYAKLYGKEVRYCSDRKEEKDHGADKGSFLGSKLKDGDRVIMIEDVTTSGKSMEETVPKVKGAADVTIVGLMVSLNRMEIGKGGEKCASDEVKELYGFDTAAIVTMEEVVEHLYNRPYKGKVIIDDTLKAEARFVRKQSAQLASKMRYLSCQFTAYLTNELWLKNASHANAMARKLYEALKDFPGVCFTQKMQSNQLFLTMPRSVIDRMLQSYFFYFWNEGNNEIRLVTSFDTTEEDIDQFIHLLNI